jgi:hypothetical protein
MLLSVLADPAVARMVIPLARCVRAPATPMVHSTGMFASRALLMTSGRTHPDGKVHMLVPVMPVLGPGPTSPTRQRSRGLAARAKPCAPE